MRAPFIVILAVGLVAALPGCRPEQTTRDRGGASTDPNLSRAMRAPRTMDFTAPTPGMVPGAGGDVGEPAQPGDLKTVLKGVDRVLVLQRKVAAQWQAIQTVDQAKAQKKALLDSAIAVFKTALSTLRTAVTLSNADLRRFVARDKVAQQETNRLRQIIKTKQQQLLSQPGGKAFMADLKQGAVARVRDLAKETLQLQRTLNARTKALGL